MEHRMNLMNLRVKIEIVLQVNCADARMKMTFSEDKSCGDGHPFFRSSLRLTRIILKTATSQPPTSHPKTFHRLLKSPTK